MGFIGGVIVAYLAVMVALIVRDTQDIDVRNAGDYLLWPRVLWNVWGQR